MTARLSPVLEVVNWSLVSLASCGSLTSPLRLSLDEHWNAGSFARLFATNR